jgi:hypothetical protein
MTISRDCVPTRSTPGFPLHTVSAGNVRTDALNADHRFASMPLHVLHADGSSGLARRQCTSEYTIASLKEAARHLLGYPHPRRVPRGVYAEQAIRISTDEITRAKDSDVAYLRNAFPLIELDWDRTRCAEYLAKRGFGHTVTQRAWDAHSMGTRAGDGSAITTPTAGARRSNSTRAIRHGLPHATQQGQALRGQYFLHRSCRPLDQADLDPPSQTGRHLRLVRHDSSEAADPDGCSPWSCRSRTSIDDHRGA